MGCDYNILINDYYRDNAKKIHKMVDEITRLKFGDVFSNDMTDFYSVANDAFADIVRNDRYDPSKGDFNGFLYNTLKFAIIDWVKSINCDKRMLKTYALDENGNKILDENGKPVKIRIHNISLDSPIGDESSTTLLDKIKSDFNIADELKDKLEDCYSDNVNNFLHSLSEMQKKVSLLIMNGYKKEEIKYILGISDKQYKDCWGIITSYEKKRILRSEHNLSKGEVIYMDNVLNIADGDVSEKFKNTSYSIYSISKQLKKKLIRDDHILQRHSGQWKNFAKSELISDILRGKSLTQVIICEEIRNGIKMQWLIDGKQRCTTIDDFLHNGFAISKNVKNYNIKYQTPKIDEKGDMVLNCDGFPVMEWKIFDIRNKKFSQLPEELQDIFNDRQIPVLYNNNCSKKDIAEDIARFNRSRPMNKAQNGWLGLDETFAEFVENIAKMQFFQPEFAGNSYTKNTNLSGTIRRIIVEGIIISDFIEEYCDFDKMCSFLSEEGSDSNFTEFYSLVERLTLICDTEKVAKLFNVKDSSLWFGLFSRFSKLGYDDYMFTAFMNDFESVQKWSVDGVSYEDIVNSTKSTKDKSLIIKKMNHLEKLMIKYFDVNFSSDDLENQTEKFIAENLNVDVESVHSEMNFYNTLLEGFEDRSIKIGSKLLDQHNRKSLLAMVAYSCQQDEDLEEWLKQYSQKNSTYILDQKDNFLHMKSDFDNYISFNN